MKSKLGLIFIFLSAIVIITGCSDSNSSYEEGYFTDKKGSYSFVLIASGGELAKIEEKWTNLTSNQINKLKDEKPNNNYRIAVQHDLSYKEIQKILKRHEMENKKFTILVYELDNVIFKSASIEEYEMFLAEL
jgi:hypothetical protein